MKKQFWSILAIVGISTMVLAGCGKGSDSKSGNETESKSAEQADKKSDKKVAGDIELGKQGVWYDQVANVGYVNEGSDNMHYDGSSILKYKVKTELLRYSVGNLPEPVTYYAKDKSSDLEDTVFVVKTDVELLSDVPSKFVDWTGQDPSRFWARDIQEMFQEGTFSIWDGGRSSTDNLMMPIYKSTNSDVPSSSEESNKLESLYSPSEMQKGMKFTLYETNFVNQSKAPVSEARYTTVTLGNTVVDKIPEGDEQIPHYTIKIDFTDFTDEYK